MPDETLPRWFRTQEEILSTGLSWGENTVSDRASPPLNPSSESVSTLMVLGVSPGPDRHTAALVLPLVGPGVFPDPVPALAKLAPTPSLAW